MRTSESTLDLFEPEFIRNPYPTLHRLREQAPVHFEPRTGLWLVSRHADIRSILADPMTFLPDNALTAITPLSITALRTLADAGFALPPTLANNGTETHAGLRKLVASYFTAPRVKASIALVRSLINPCLDQLEGHLAAGESCNLVSAIADWLPATVLLRLLGIGPVDMGVFKAWSQASLELFWGNPNRERQLELAMAAGEFHQWLVHQVHSAPDNDGLIPTLLAHRIPDGRALSIEEIVGVLYFLLIAGQETTTELVSIAFQRLIGQPSLWQQLGNDHHGLAEACVEEVLRLEPPVVTWRRVTSRATRLSGVHIPAGAAILLMLSAAGSDPNVFAESENFCPYRPKARGHLAFGYGRHFCLGAALARAETAEILRATAARLPGIYLIEQQPQDMLGLLSFRAPMRVIIARSGER